MIAIDDNGNFVTNAAGLLTETRTPAVQNAKAELRCLQGTWEADQYFGRNAIVWGVSQSTQDRTADINRVVSKYATCLFVAYDSLKKQYNVQVA